MEKLKSFEFHKSSIVYIYSVKLILYLVCLKEAKRLDTNDSKAEKQERYISDPDEILIQEIGEPVKNN